MLVMFCQREGYPYHYYPSGVMAILALTTLFLDGGGQWASNIRNDTLDTH